MSEVVRKPALNCAIWQTQQFDEITHLPLSEQFQTIHRQAILEAIS